MGQSGSKTEAGSGSLGSGAASGGAAAGGAAAGAGGGSVNSEMPTFSEAEFRSLITPEETTLAQSALLKNVSLRTSSEQLAIAKFNLRTVLQGYFNTISELIGLANTFPYTEETYTRVTALINKLREDGKSFNKATVALQSQILRTPPPGKTVEQAQKPINDFATKVTKLMFSVRLMANEIQTQTYKIKKAADAERATFENEMRQILSQMHLAQLSQRYAALMSGGARRRRRRRHTKKRRSNKRRATAA
jgi:hypothetical protein